MSSGCKYGSNFEVHWREKSRETLKNESQSKADSIRGYLNRFTQAAVRWGDKALELKDHEEAFVGSYYVKVCILAQLGCQGGPRE
jgi:hypothetical protein